MDIQHFPADYTEQILFPLCISAEQFAQLAGAVDYATHVTTENKGVFRAELERLVATLQYIETPEEAPCFPLCDILNRLVPSPDGKGLLEYIDDRCGTEYTYLDYCEKVGELLTEAGGTAETFYAALVADYLLNCGLPPVEFPTFPESDDLCSQLVTELTTNPTFDAVLALLTSCSIDIDYGYDWETIYSLNASTSTWVSWNSPPYANIPANRSRFAWSFGNGLITSFGTPGGTGGSTQLHYLYAKAQGTQTTITQVFFTYNCPNQTGTDIRINVFLANLGVVVYTSANLSLLEDGVDHNVTLVLDTPVTADLVAFAVTGGSSAGDAPIKLVVVSVRGRGVIF